MILLFYLNLKDLKSKWIKSSKIYMTVQLVTVHEIKYFFVFYFDKPTQRGDDYAFPCFIV